MKSKNIDNLKKCVIFPPYVIMRDDFIKKLEEVVQTHLKVSLGKYKQFVTIFRFSWERFFKQFGEC